MLLKLEIISRSCNMHLMLLFVTLLSLGYSRPCRDCLDLLDAPTESPLAKLSQVNRNSTVNHVTFLHRQTPTRHWIFGKEKMRKRETGGMHAVMQMMLGAGGLGSFCQPPLYWWIAYRSYDSKAARVVGLVACFRLLRWKSNRAREYLGSVLTIHKP